MMNAKDTVEMTPARELLQRKETGELTPPRPLDHLALSIIVGHGADWTEGLRALARLRAAFVDWNEARVARVQELARALGDVPGAEALAVRVKERYNAFFDKKGALSFDFLAAGKPSESKRALAQLMPTLNKGAVALLLFEFCPGSPLPLSDEALKQARKDGLVGKSAERNQLVRLLADSLELSEVALLLQHWEIAATGTPYGEAAAKEAAGGKKTKKKPGKTRPGGKK